VAVRDPITEELEHVGAAVGVRQGSPTEGRPRSPPVPRLSLGRGLRRLHASLLFPHVETVNVQSKELPVLGQGHPLDHQRIFCDDPIAGAAELAVAGPTPDPGDVVERQSTVRELLANQEPKAGRGNGEPPA
jgi:hypothetical protein